MLISVKNIYRKIAISLGVLFTASAVFLNVQYGYSIIYSATDSIKKGLWFFWDCDQGEIEPGSFVLFTHNWEASLHAEMVPNYKKLIKLVAHSGNDDSSITDSGSEITICSPACVSYARLNTVPYEVTSLVNSDEIFVVGISPNSFDSRYFGPIKKSIVEKCGAPL